MAQRDLLGNPKLVDDLKSYNADAIPAAIIEKIAPYVARDDFTTEIVTRASVAAGGLCKWVHAIVVYDKTARIVAPKKASLAAATATLAEAEIALAAKRAQLGELKEKLAKLQAELDAAVTRKNSLQAEVRAVRECISPTPLSQNKCTCISIDIDTDC